MADAVASPTHFRLLSALRAIGPYLRESESQDGKYLFDCLSVCVDEKRSPEEREFWGWWMELEPNSQDKINGYVAQFRFGLYNFEGSWRAEDVPQKARAEVVRNQGDFVEKLRKVLEERFSLTLAIHEESEEFA